jgi:hypothetical protein
MHYINSRAMAMTLGLETVDEEPTGRHRWAHALHLAH